MFTITITGDCCQSGSPKSGAMVGTIDPEGSIIASPGALYWNTTNKTLWVKDVGTDNNGWLQNV